MNKLPTKEIILTSLIFGAAAATAQITTYSGNPAGHYTSVTDYTSCDEGPCKNYNTSMTQSGTFTVPSPLSPNLAFSNITASISSFSLSDGVNTFSSSDQDTRLIHFLVSTDASGNVTTAEAFVELWLTGSSPHQIGDLVALGQFGNPTYIIHNAACGVVDLYEDTADSCLSYRNVFPSMSKAQANTRIISWSKAAAPSVSTASIPALSEWGLIGLSSILAVLGIGWMARRQG